jgi:hypothetical protein
MVHDLSFTNHLRPNRGNLKSRLHAPITVDNPPYKSQFFPPEADSRIPVQVLPEDFRPNLLLAKCVTIDLRRLIGIQARRASGNGTVPGPPV